MLTWDGVNLESSVYNSLVDELDCAIKLMRSQTENCHFLIIIIYLYLHLIHTHLNPKCMLLMSSILNY